MQELTQEQKTDVEERKKEFLEKYTSLTEELHMDFVSLPMWMPTGPGTFSLIINAQLQDKKYLAPLSPIQP